MPQLKVMAWNIETFGDATRTRGNYVAMCNFIAHVVNNQQIDILVIEELRAQGPNYLSTLITALNTQTGGVWYGDFVLGALSVDPSITLPTNVGDTRLDADHHEGYALLWNGSRSNDFTIAQQAVPLSMGPVTFINNGIKPGHVPNQAIGLVFEGRDQSGGFLTTGWYTAPAWNNNAPNADDALSFSRSAWSSTYGKLSPKSARRPCTFTINLDPANNHNDPDQYLVPVTVYHCTSNLAHRRLNTQLCGYSRQLYQAYDALNNNWVNTDNAIVCGDFNIDARNNTTERDAYLVFTSTFGNDGANCTSGFGGFNANSPKTTVQIRSIHNGQLYTGTTANDFKRLSIDHIFYRLPNNQPTNTPQVALVDMFSYLINAPYATRAFITAFWDVLENLLGATLTDINDQPYYQNYPQRENNSYTPQGTNGIPIIGYIANWENYEYALIAGHFNRVNLTNTNDDYRTAAEFINTTISDHLPIVISFNY